MVRNGQNYRKGGKIFQIFENFSINSKKIEIIWNFYPFELWYSTANSRKSSRRNSQPILPGTYSCSQLAFQYKFYNFSWSNEFLMAKLTWAPWPTWISRFFPCIGLSIRGKGAWNRVHTWLFWKQPRMYTVSGPFSAYSQPYTRKKPRYPRGP